jgi:uncharacterized protein (DUF1919 family)
MKELAKASEQKATNKISPFLSQNLIVFRLTENNIAVEVKNCVTSSPLVL